MIEIKDILLRFDNILKNEDSKILLIVEAIQKIINIKIKKKDIKINNDILYLNIKPIYKNEILLKKNEIISFINNNIKNRKIDKIF